MRAIMIAACIACALYSCTSSSSTSASSADSLSLDSIVPPTTLDQKLPATDSFTLQQEKIAFGNMRFGMKEKEVNKVSKKEIGYGIQIGNESYYVSPIYDDRGDLYKVEIQSSSEDANYIETDVQRAHDNLVNIITAKYGNADSETAYPSILKLSSGFITWTHTWNVGIKAIKIGVGEVSSGAEFYSVCWIYNSSMEQTYNIRQYSKKDSINKSDASKF